jgi:hypothetical protein
VTRNRGAEDNERNYYVVIDGVHHAPKPREVALGWARKKGEAGATVTVHVVRNGHRVLVAAWKNREKTK